MVTSHITDWISGTWAASLMLHNRGRGHFRFWNGCDTIQDGGRKRKCPLLLLLSIKLAAYTTNVFSKTWRKNIRQRKNKNCTTTSTWFQIIKPGNCPACRTSLIATRFWVVVICPIIKCLTVLEFSFILFDLCLFITIFNFILNYVPIVTFWIFTYHKIWILLIIFYFIWNYLFFNMFGSVLECCELTGVSLLWPWLIKWK